MSRAVPAVRIATLLTCPNSECGRTIYSPSIRYGELWMKCNVGGKARHGSCPAHWLNVTLPPGATGHTLERLVGRASAIEILATVVKPPWSVPADTVLSLQLSGETGKPVHVQITCRARDEHHLRYAPMADVLRALQISTHVEHYSRAV